VRLITSDYEEKIWILRILILVYDPFDKEAYYIIYFIILVTLNRLSAVLGITNDGK
jgi:hypothetical protein